MIHVLGIRQFLLQSTLLSLQLTAKSLPALISTAFICCANYAQKQEEYSSPLQKNLKSFFNERKKKILIKKKSDIFYCISTELQFPQDMNPEKSWLDGEIDSDRNFQGQLEIN